MAFDVDSVVVAHVAHTIAAVSVKKVLMHLRKFQRPGQVPLVLPALVLAFVSLRFFLKNV